mgnify:CR=1 FL=1
MGVFVMVMAAAAAFFMLAFPAPAFAAESVGVIAAALDVVSVIVPCIVPIASLFVSLTKTPAPGTLWGRVYRVIEILALVFGRAKEVADTVATSKPGYEGHQLCSALDHECEARRSD